MPLVVVPTPIGNMEDITLRALRVLREADVIACEDTRRTGRLLARHGIENRLLAYHEHNEDRLAPRLCREAREKIVALVSDAGMPLVSDPGYRLVRRCIEAGVRVEALPGPSALTTALAVSGLPADVVIFAGFVPRRGRGREELLEKVRRERATFVLFESPNRLARTLEELPPEAPVAVCRELTKLHEEVFRGTAKEAAERFAAGARGEVVVVVRGGEGVGGNDLEEALADARRYVSQGESPSRAASRAARGRGVSRGEVYDRLVRREG